MVIGRSDETRPVFGVWRMALALVLAAFLGGALGLAWQRFGADEEEVAPEALNEDLTAEESADES